MRCTTFIIDIVTIKRKISGKIMHKYSLNKKQNTHQMGSIEPKRRRKKRTIHIHHHHNNSSISSGGSSQWTTHNEISQLELKMTTMTTMKWNQNKSISSCEDHCGFVLCSSSRYFFHFYWRDGAYFFSVCVCVCCFISFGLLFDYSLISSWFDIVRCRFFSSFIFQLHKTCCVVVFFIRFFGCYCCWLHLVVFFSITDFEMCKRGMKKKRNVKQKTVFCACKREQVFYIISGMQYEQQNIPLPKYLFVEDFLRTFVHWDVGFAIRFLSRSCCFLMLICSIRKLCAF